MTRGMFRTCTVEAMRQQQDQAALSKPFSFRAHNVLVNNELSWIVEVSKLGFPSAEVLGRLQTVPILVSHNA